jgi:hypothetical protein
MKTLPSVIAIIIAASTVAESAEPCSGQTSTVAEILADALGLQDLLPERENTEVASLFSVRDVVFDGIGPDPVSPNNRQDGPRNGWLDRMQNISEPKVFCSAYVSVNLAFVRSLNDSVLSQIIRQALPGTHLAVPPPRKGDQERYMQLRARMAPEALMSIARGVRARYTIEGAGPDAKVMIINFPNWD